MRSFQFICIFTFLFSLASNSITVNAQRNKPNILFLFSDDQRMDAVGAYGNPYIQTPNLDRLAQQGTRFTNNFCMGSHHGAVCAPSRAMLMSGKSLFNVYDKLEGVTIMPEVLKDQGYVTFGTGKWHNEKTAFARGFEYGRNVFFGGMSDHFEVPVVDLKEDGSFTEVETNGFSTRIFTDAVVDFVQDYSANGADQPFFAYVAYTTPHDPRSPVQDYIDYYPPNALPLPADFMATHPFDLGVMTIRDENLGKWPRSAAQVRQQLADYYGLITHMDHEIGRILQTLENNNLLHNTLIIFSSDHGLAIGSHGLLGKQSLYETSMKAPLIISGPGIPTSTTTDALVYLYDLFPTLLDYLELEIPEGVDGQSIMPVISGEVKDIRNSLFTAYSGSQRAVKDHRWKLIQYPEIHHTQLFDLKHDPYELNNLAQIETYQPKVNEMMDLLREWQQKTNDDQPLMAQQKKPMEYDLSDYKPKPDRHQPEYTIKKYFEE